MRKEHQGANLINRTYLDEEWFTVLAHHTQDPHTTFQNSFYFFAYFFQRSKANLLLRLNYIFYL